MDLLIVLLVAVLCWFLLCEEVSERLSHKHPHKVDLISITCLIVFWVGLLGLVILYTELYEWWMLWATM